jgi:predicted secreted hydrolase
MARWITPAERGSTRRATARRCAATSSRSPASRQATGSRYPTGFDVRVGDESFAIEAVTPRSINASVLVDGIEYFEGPITVKRDGRVVGRGYVELTGYDPDAKLPI